MSVFVVRVWLPDRPGALGAVASRIGAVRGDVIGIDIVERGAGRAVDELVIDLPDPTVVDLMVAEIGEVDGVDVEDVRAMAGPPPDPAVAALTLAARLRSTPTECQRDSLVVDGALELLGAQWSVLVDEPTGEVLARAGAALPSDAWLGAFVRGATAGECCADLDEVALSTAPDGRRVLVVSRPRLPLRGRERAVMAGLACLL